MFRLLPRDSGKGRVTSPRQLLSRLGLLQNGGLPLGGQGVVDTAQLGDGLKTNVADDLFVDSSSKELVET